MKKFIVLVGFVLVCNTAFAYSNDEIVEKLKQIKELKSQIANLLQDRHNQEEALVEEYKVNEINQKRDALAVDSSEKISFIEKQIDELQEDIETNI